MLDASNWIALGAFLVAAVALLLSIATFYVQFIRKTASLTARLDDFGGSDQAMTLRAMFSNTGNQPTVVSRVQLLLENRGAGYSILDGHCERLELPLSLKQRDIQEGVFVFPYSQSTVSYVLEDDPGRNEVPAIVSIEAKDSRGRTFEREIEGFMIRFVNLRFDGLSFSAKTLDLMAKSVAA